MTPQEISLFTEARRSFHTSLLNSVLQINANGIPANADKDSTASVAIARGIINQLGGEITGARLAGQTAGNRFEEICKIFLELTFNQLKHLRPGNWKIKCVGSRNRLEIAKYEQYSHLIALQVAAKKDANLAAALGSDYTITPDVIILRETEEDAVINKPNFLIDDKVAQRASLRKKYNALPLLHASISCKWTLRSDRAQNARSEAFNLIRNRKGRLPHVAVVIGEPLPSRIASLALGTGDIDCVYHFALPELAQTLDELNYQDAKDLFNIMVEGKRLKDIADLPLDLAI